MLSQWAGASWSTLWEDWPAMASRPSSVTSSASWTSSSCRLLKINQYLLGTATRCYAANLFVLLGPLYVIVILGIPNDGRIAILITVSLHITRIQDLSEGGWSKIQWI